MIYLYFVLAVFLLFTCSCLVSMFLPHSDELKAIREAKALAEELQRKKDCRDILRDMYGRDNDSC